MYRYKAFGLNICSEFEIPHISKGETDAPVDVWIKHVNLRDQDVPDDKNFYSREENIFNITDLALFRVRNGNLIEIEPVEDYRIPHLAVYIMGAGMGSIIHQRGLFPIHGSCVTDGKHTIIISGFTGSGKSTMASEFLKHGWKLLSDDVSIVKNVDGIPVVQSSYPSQKLWPDSIAKYDRDKDKIHSLYERNGKFKMGIDVSEIFIEGTAPLTLFVRLIADENITTDLYPVKGIPAIVNQLSVNTYRSHMIDKRDLQKHFQRCVTLATKVPMVIAARKTGENTSEFLYNCIVEYCEKS